MPNPNQEPSSTSVDGGSVSTAANSSAANSDAANSDSTFQIPQSVQLGGQALIEGVMMRSPRFVGAAVRRADGTIQTRVEAFEPIAKRHRWLGWPLLRGVVGLVEMLALGMKYLNWSSNLALQDTPSSSAAPTQSPVNGQSTLSPADPSSNGSESNRSAPRDSTPQSTLSAAAVASEEIGAGATMAMPTFAAPDKKTSAEKTADDKSLPLWMFLGTVALSLGLGFCLFVATPNIVADWTLGRYTRHRVPSTLR